MSSKGKQKKPYQGGFVMSFECVLKSPAYRDLRPAARVLLIEFQRICLPYRNGKLSLSVKNAAKLINVSEPTAGDAFHELAEHGFIVLTSGELWQERKAREWRLSIWECNGREASSEWEQWHPDYPLVETKRRKKSRPKKQGQSAKKTGAGYSKLMASVTEQAVSEINNQ